MEKFVIATTQVDIKKDSLQHNLDAHVRLIGEAAGDQLVMFPELGVTGHNSTH